MTKSQKKTVRKQEETITMLLNALRNLEKAASHSAITGLTFDAIMTARSAISIATDSK